MTLLCLYLSSRKHSQVSMEKLLLEAAATLKSFQRRLPTSFEGEEDSITDNGSEPVTSSELAHTFDVKGVENILDYEFKNKSLLVESYTDLSYDVNSSISYERLEFLGDSILNLVMTKELYSLYPNESPGTLTKLRAANIDTEKLARVSVKYNLHRFLLHNKPLLADQIVAFEEDIKKDPKSLHSSGLFTAPKSLADIVESTIGALYIDCDYSVDTVWKVIKPLLEPIIPLHKLEKHPMTALNELGQKHQLKLTFKDTWKETKDYYFFLEGKWVGYGRHAVKKETARYCAAKNAVDNFPYFFRDYC